MGHRRAQAADLLALGKLLVNQGDCLAARTTLEECLAILREAADRWGAAEALFYLGRVEHALGDLGAARRHWEATLALDMEKMGRGGYVVLCLAQLTAAEGDAAAARAQCEQFIRQELEAGTRSGAPSGLAALAEAGLAARRRSESRHGLSGEPGPLRESGRPGGGSPVPLCLVEPRLPRGG